MEPASLRLGRSNLYLLDSGDGLICIDAGAPLRQTLGAAQARAWDSFVHWLSTLGYQPSQVRSLLLTHVHPDHLALAHHLQRCGAKVFIHQAEAAALRQASRQAQGDALAGRDDRRAAESQMRSLLAEYGVPQDLIESWTATRASPRWQIPPLEPDGVVTDGAELDWGNLRLRAIHCPGHSPGSVAYYQPDTKALFSGDHLLRRTLPHLGIYFSEGNRFRALPAYLRSLDKVAALEIDRVYPGHGVSFDQADREIQWLRHQHQNRLGQVRELLEQGPLTAFEMLPQLFPQLRPAHWPVGLGQVIGCLDELEARGLGGAGRVKRGKEGVWGDQTGLGAAYR